MRKQKTRRRSARLRQTARASIEVLESRLAFSHTSDSGYVPVWDAAAAIGVPDERVSPSPFSSSFTYQTLPSGLPILNSFPNAPTAIYMDLDGDLNWLGVQVQPYDFNGNPASYSLDEQHAIVENWRELSAYFAMFNVNVTTIKPPSNVPMAWLAWGANTFTNGGFGAVGSFPSDPSGVSHSLTGSGFQFRVGDTHAHEVGHNFGSWHIGNYDNFGNETEQYATARDPLHGPIMGNGPTGVIEKWSIWHETGGGAVATLMQDDMAIIAAAINARDGSGDGYRPDDYSGTIATATQLLTSGSTQAITGIIERLTDVDAFKFTSAGGRYSILVGRDYPSGVDVKVSIYDAVGTMIAQHDGDPRTVPYTMVNDTQLTLDLAAGTYTILVESHGNYGDQGQYVVRVDPMAANWKSQDVGLNRVPGYAGYSSATSTFTVAGSGADIWGTKDGFQYVYQTLTGDGEIIVRVTGMENTASWAKAGVMMRESLADNAREAYLVMTPSNGVQWSWRTSTGGTTGATTPNTNTSFVPSWLRLVRSGNSFTAYRSTSTNLPTSWTQIGSPRSVTMGSTIYVGMVVSSVYNEVLNQATFTNVNVTGKLNGGPTLNTLPAPTSVSVEGPTSNSINVSWAGISIGGDINSDGTVNTLDLNSVKSNFGRSGAGDANGDGVVDIRDYNLVKNNFGKSLLGYAIERSTDGVYFSQVGTTSLGVTSYVDNGLADFQRYHYRVRALDAIGVSTPSTAASAITRAGAVTDLRIISYSTSQLVLDWTDASGETGYRVQRSSNGVDNWTNVSAAGGITVGKNVPMFTNTGRNANTQYFYRIVTVDALGDSATSNVVSAFTKMSAPTGLAFTTKASSQMAFQWNALATATSYTIQRSTDGANFSTIATGVTTTSYADNSVSPVNPYYYRVFGVNANTISMYSSVIFAATPAATALPSPWESNDINITTTNGNRTGAAGLNGTTLTVVGGGTDIWGSSDQFRFTYVPMTGNGSITARVVSVVDTNYYSRAGVMIRNTTTGTNTASNSAFAAVMVHQSDAGVRYQYRTAGGNGTGETVFGGGPEAAPYWVRLTRTGNSFLAEASANGTAWSTVGTQNISMNSTVLVGLALTPRENSLLNKAVFTNVSITTSSGTITFAGAAAGGATSGSASASGKGPSSGGSNAGSMLGGTSGSLKKNQPASPSILTLLDFVNHSKKKAPSLQLRREVERFVKSAETRRAAKQITLVDLALVDWRLDRQERAPKKAKIDVDLLESIARRK